MIKPNSVNLKENIFICVGTEIPRNAKRMIVGSMQFVSEEEAKWYVVAEKGRFKNYLNKKDHQSAKDSLISAVQKITGKEEISNVKFTIYSFN